MLHLPNLAPSPVPNHANHLFILLLVRCIFSICWVPSIVLGVADAWMNEAYFSCQGAYNLVEFLAEMLLDNEGDIC